MNLIDTIGQQKTSGPLLYPAAAASSLTTARPLTEACKTEALAFLAEHPVRTFGMLGFILDNGLVSSQNRGAFYECRDIEGQLQGVALIGHATMFETRSELAIEAFARLAQGCPSVQQILGEEEKAQYFWRHYANEKQEPRLFCRDLLFEQKWPLEDYEAAPQLRLAEAEDLYLVAQAHAQMSIEENGKDALRADPEGFYRRCARRIEQGRTWVWIEDRKLIFKAEIIADTPEVVYIEGVWVNHQERGKGYGLRCMSQLGRILLQRTATICLLVNEQKVAAQFLYRKAGYRFVSYYNAFFI